MKRSILFFCLIVSSIVLANGKEGYYRFPSIYENKIVFTAEGDLWIVDSKGGVAQRLTTHHSMETHAEFSPDGFLILFSAQYEGPTEIYTIPVSGGLPTRWTYEGGTATVIGWTPKGNILYSTRKYSTLPNTQLVEINIKNSQKNLIPLNQASDGCYEPNEKHLFFTRLPFQGSYTKRYVGGTAQNLWKYSTGSAEAIPITTDYPGTSKNPLVWQNRHLPLVNRITDRDELGDLISHLVGELSALHIFVRGGDKRQGDDKIQLASLGAKLVRDDKQNGYRIDYIYKSEPDYVDQLSPLVNPELNIQEGDIITAINGVKTLSVADPGILLKNQIGQQVLLSIKSAKTKQNYNAVVKPISQSAETNLRYNDWEYSRRLCVEDLGDGELGYVHLRAMGGGNYTEWVRNFYPVFNRKGLIIDVRHNRGGNIDSWILEKLMRKAWFYWKDRVGKPTWNMQYAFRGHMVILCNERTASDGEAITEGFRRLGLGKVIGTRTWGGEIWLSGNNYLVDRGVATAAESGVYGPEGEWLIEGYGVVPDMEVDNLPHATFKGYDVQLDAAIKYLQEKIEKEPVDVPDHPKYPDKSIKYKNK